MSLTKQMIDMYDSGMSLRAITDALDLPNVPYIARRFEKLCIPTRPAGGRWPTHGQYVEGRRINVGGYIRQWIPEDDPMASMRNWAGYVLEHRLVKARELCRPLLPTETVHHIDGDKKNNEPFNLQLLRGTHAKGVAMCCADCGSYNIVTVKLQDN